ncbi:MAG: hypothetical protein ABI589_11320 [Burkholderiales bacterium]
MQAQAILIVLHDGSAGYDVTPDRVPLASLSKFTRSVEEFLQGDDGDIDASSFDVSIVKGSLGVLTAPTANPALLNDLRRLTESPLLEGIAKKRRVVMERWQKAARRFRNVWFEIRADFLPAPVVINADSDFRSDDADQWVRVERYVRGEIEDMGGHTNPNAHIRLPDGKTLLVEADRQTLGDQKINRLYKPAMVRIVAEYNVMTREYRSARLLEFVEHENRLDEKQLERLTERGAKAWRDVPDAGAWVDGLRGSAD